MPCTLLSMVRASLDEELSFHTVKGCRNWKASRRKRSLAWAGGKSKTCWLGRCAEQASVPGMCFTGRWPLTEGCVKLLGPFITKKDCKKKARQKEKTKKRKKKTLLVRSATRFLAFVPFRLQPLAGEEIAFFIKRNSLSGWAGSVNLAGLRRLEVLKPQTTGPGLLDMP